MTRGIRDVSLCVVVSTICIASLELALHLTGVKLEGSLFIHDDARRFRLRANAAGWFTEENEVYVTINGQGYRDRDRTLRADPGVFRVAVVGDSNVAGFMVNAEETFTRVAERTVSASMPGRKIEVLNFGVPNYNLAQQFLTLHDDVFAYRPDLVIEAVSLTNAILNSTRETCVNDSPYPYFLEHGDGLELYDPHRTGALDSSTEAALLDAENRIDIWLLILKGSRVLSSVADSWKEKLSHQSRPAHLYDRSLYPPREESVSRAWRISEETLSYMNDLCRSQKVPLWILTMDIAGQVDPDLSKRQEFARILGTRDIYYADTRLAHFAQTHNIPYIQSAPLLGEYALQTGKCLHGFFNTPRNSGHMNAEGHRVLGLILASRIAQAMVPGS